MAWRRQWHPTPVLLPGKAPGWRSLVGCRPWGHEESDTTERLHFDFSLSCIGEGNGNPLQCSCLENPGKGEPGGPLSVGSHRVGHDWSDLAAAAAYKWHILENIILYILRCEKHPFNSNSFSCRTSNLKKNLPCQGSLHNASESISVLNMALDLFYPFFSDNPNNHSIRECASVGPLSTLSCCWCRSHMVSVLWGWEAGLLMPIWGEQLPPHPSNDFAQHYAIVIPNVNLQGKIFSKCRVWKPMFLLHLSFPLSLGLRP